MPNPTAHADDMKSLAVIEPNTSPAFWWVNPWAYALSMKRALDAVYLLSETTEDAYKAATTVIKQKDELVDYHRNNLNTFQRKVELTLKPVFGNGGYEDTLDLVSFAADEIKALRAERTGLLHETKVAVAEAESLRHDLQKTVLYNNSENIASGRRIGQQFKERDDQIDGLYADIEREKQRVEEITLMVNDRDRQIDTRDKEIIRLTNSNRRLKCKLSRAEKAAGIKPAKKKAKYGDARDGYAALGREVLKGLAKKKGVRRA